MMDLRMAANSMPVPTRSRCATAQDSGAQQPWPAAPRRAGRPVRRELPGGGSLVHGAQRGNAVVPGRAEIHVAPRLRALALVLRLGADVPGLRGLQARDHALKAVDAEVGHRTGEGLGAAREALVLVERDADARRDGLVRAADLRCVGLRLGRLPAGDHLGAAEPQHLARGVVADAQVPVMLAARDDAQLNLTASAA